LASIPRPVIVKQIKPSHRARTDLGSPPIPSCKKAASGAGLARSFPRKIDCGYLCGEGKNKYLFFYHKNSHLLADIGGETGIRTLGRLSPSTVFETAPFDHSGTSPRRVWAAI
jgi:hypothetical protein